MHPLFILLMKSLSQADERCNLKHSQLVFDIAPNTAIRDTESRVLIKNKLLVLKIIFMEAFCREKERKLNEISYTSKYIFLILSIYLCHPITQNQLITSSIGLEMYASPFWGIEVFFTKQSVVMVG